MGQRIGEIIITALWPVIWVLYVIVGAIVFLEAAAVYLAWYAVSAWDRVFRSQSRASC